MLSSIKSSMFLRAQGAQTGQGSPAPTSTDPIASKPQLKPQLSNDKVSFGRLNETQRANCYFSKAISKLAERFGISVKVPANGTSRVDSVGAFRLSKIKDLISSANKRMNLEAASIKKFKDEGELGECLDRLYENNYIHDVDVTLPDSAHTLLYLNPEDLEKIELEYPLVLDIGNQGKEHPVYVSKQLVSKEMQKIIDDKLKTESSIRIQYAGASLSLEQIRNPKTFDPSGWAIKKEINIYPELQ